MENKDLAAWWSSLPIKEKERIARKGQSKASKDGSVQEDQVQYPACTRWWNTLDQTSKLKIYVHCVVRHGDQLKEWKEGNPYGD